MTDTPALVLPTPRTHAGLLSLLIQPSVKTQLTGRLKAWAIDLRWRKTGDKRLRPLKSGLKLCVFVVLST
jgi:hypothetical protein